MIQYNEKRERKNSSLFVMTPDVRLKQHRLNPDI